ncbi:pectin lyase-like superfamily protein [Actinidia rufa]|uniref:Pectin lyase-like superfamily protein n=1 Tax=Actinidia rufa TaxID=165716 RepID=A0A7J0ERG3_9ERIC|nr:pectin lyase-like superfamily protein [Actinidia rufa]
MEFHFPRIFTLFSSVLLCFLLLPFHSFSQISLPPSPAPEAAGLGPVAVFSVLSFGAVGDGVTDDTPAFKMAWDTACQTKSATLLVPLRYSFMIQSTIFTGPCKSGLVLQGGNRKRLPGPCDSPVVSTETLSLSQNSNSTGKSFTKKNSTVVSMQAIRFFMSSNLTVQGLKIKNSPQFHFRFDGCRDVRIDSLYITAPPQSPNTDGIHIENTNNVKIYNSVVSNGDDCVSIGAGCYNVDIRNITCDPSHGISIGSLGMRNTRPCVSNITVSDSVVKNSDNGVRIKTWQGGSGSVSKVTFNNIHMESVKNPIIIDQYYCLSKGCPNQNLCTTHFRHFICKY